MRAFFLRELAFLMLPALMLTRLKELLSRVTSVLIAAAFVWVLTKTLLVFALGPAGWIWLGVVIGLGVVALLLIALLTSGM